jgi:predicted transcriptional regulator
MKGLYETLPVKEPRDYSLLKEVGLSKNAIMCYQDLANQGSTKVSVLAARLQMPRMTVYRLVEKLHTQGFLYKTKLDGWSTIYKAKPINKAFEGYIDYQRRKLAPLLGGYEESSKVHKKGL